MYEFQYIEKKHAPGYNDFITFRLNVVTPNIIHLLSSINKINSKVDFDCEENTWYPSSFSHKLFMNISNIGPLYILLKLEPLQDFHHQYIFESNAVNGKILLESNLFSIE